MSLGVRGVYLAVAVAVAGQLGHVHVGVGGGTRSTETITRTTVSHVERKIGKIRIQFTDQLV